MSKFKAIIVPKLVLPPPMSTRTGLDGAEQCLLKVDGWSVVILPVNVAAWTGVQAVRLSQRNREGVLISHFPRFFFSSWYKLNSPVIAVSLNYGPWIRGLLGISIILFWCEVHVVGERGTLRDIVITIIVIWMPRYYETVDFKDNESLPRVLPLWRR